MGRLTVAEAFGDSVIYDTVLQDANFGQTLGVNSIFNKFSMFRYHKYGPSFVDYRKEFHIDGKNATNNPTNDPTSPEDAANRIKLNTFIGINTTGNGQPLKQGTINQNDNASMMFKAIGVVNQVPLVARASTQSSELAFQNPTARTIIEWSKNDNKVFGPTPYSWTDFIYCKWNGLIPNNRLVTLRRFPFPVRDNLKSISGAPAIPIAQAVTWFGEKTDNKIKDIIPGIGWSLPWKELDAQDGQGNIVQGNNLTLDDVLAGLENLPVAGAGVAKIKGTLKAVIGGLAGASGNTEQINKLSGQYKNYQDYLKNDLYSSAGPYWNQVLGGVNYISQTLIRDRMGKSDEWKTPINLKFTYSLRSFNGIKPKIAMLDLISNFLSLTYMNAEFKGNFSRFFRNAGVASDPTIDEAISQLAQKGDVIGAYQLIAASVAYDALAGAAAAADIKLNLGTLDSLKKSFQTGDFNQSQTVGKNKNGDEVKFTDILNGALLSTAFKGLAKGPIVMRSTLTGEPTGEWHMVIGNPLEPIATVGNLVCSGCKMEFGEELGPDDFPTEVNFIVTLRMAKPRDKFEIESMFNLGNGFLTENPISPPNSNTNTFGKDSLAKAAAVNSPNLSTQVRDTDLTDSQRANLGTAKARLGIAYGQVYANSAVLPLYFMDNSRLTANTDLKGNKPVNP